MCSILLGPHNVFSAARRRIRHGFLVYGAVVFAAIGVTQAQEVNDKAIGNGDLLQISVFGEPSISGILSGQFRVGSDGTISYPALGALKASGRLPEDVAAMLRDGLGDQVPISGMPTVSISEYAPVFLIGNVMRPGPHQYQPGLTILDLILSTGGLPQPPNADTRLQSAEQEISDLGMLAFALSVERDRLTAEIARKTFDGTSIGTLPGERFAAIVANEVAIFDAHRRAEATQLSAYEAQRKTYDREFQSLQQSIALHEEEIGMVVGEVATQQSLTDRGLAPRTRLADLKRELVTMQRQALEFRTASYRAQQNLLAADQKMREVETNGDIATINELRRVEVELARTELRIGAAQGVIASINSEATVLRNAFGSVPTYTLIRRVEGAYVPSVVDESATLQRGDIVRVELDTSDTRADSRLGEEQHATEAGIVTASPD